MPLLIQNTNEYRNVVESVYKSASAFLSQESARADLPEQYREGDTWKSVLESVTRVARQRVFEREEAGRVIDKVKEWRGIHE